MGEGDTYLGFEYSGQSDVLVLVMLMTKGNAQGVVVYLAATTQTHQTWAMQTPEVLSIS